MDKLTALFDKLDPGNLVPQMDKLLSVVQTVASVAILLGPAVMVLLGVWYLFFPPEEANHRAGFRTYFGMGSVEAWQFTQKLAGIALGASGLILGIIMTIICAGYGRRDVMDVVESAIRCLIWQAGIVFVVYLGVTVTVTVMFDANGDRRLLK